MSAGLPLDPLLSAASAVIGHAAAFQGVEIGVFIHIGYHQNFPGLIVLNHHRDEAVRPCLKLLPGNRRGKGVDRDMVALA